MNSHINHLLIAVAFLLLSLMCNSCKEKAINNMKLQTQKMKKANPMEDVKDKFIKINGLKLHYRDFGNENAPPLLILHGLSGHAWEFNDAARILSEDFHVITVNQRGHGDSDWAGDYSPELMADDVATFIDSLNLGKVAVIGHSMGGVNTWWLAARYPEKVSKVAILDISPTTICREDMLGVWQSIFDQYSDASYLTLEEGIQDYLSFYNGTKEGLLRDFAKEALKQGKDGKWTWKLDSENLIKWVEATAGSEKKQWELLSQIKSSTLIIYGGDSPYSDYEVMEKMSDSIPNSILVHISHSGHDIHFDQLELLMKSLKDFMCLT